MHHIYLSFQLMMDTLVSSIRAVCYKHKMMSLCLLGISLAMRLLDHMASLLLVFKEISTHFFPQISPIRHVPSPGSCICWQVVQPSLTCPRHSPGCLWQVLQPTPARLSQHSVLFIGWCSLAQSNLASDLGLHIC